MSKKFILEVPEGVTSCDQCPFIQNKDICLFLSENNICNVYNFSKPQLSLDLDN